MNEQARAAIAKVFEEWQRRYQADPSAFVPHDIVAGTAPPTYGEQAAESFEKMADAVGVVVVAA